jgi:hypothetical protein
VKPIPGTLLRAAILLGSLIVPTRVQATENGPSPPNVVLIIADDMAWTDYGFMGHPQIRTPRLDRLASQSLVFRRGYVTTSLCSPSLASILTGRYPHQHKITGNDPPLPPGVNDRLAQRNPEFLKQRQEMINYFDEMPAFVQAGRVHGRDDQRRPRARRSPRGRRAGDRAANDAAAVAVHGAGP